MTTSLQDLKSKKFYVALVAELLGTMLLVLVACGSCLVPDTNTVQISLCFGLSVASIVWAIANVSGGHINPAVTIGFMAARRISVVRFILYIVFQCAGALIGAGLLRGLTPDSLHATLGTSGPSIKDAQGEFIVSQGQAFGIELFLGFVLVFVVFGTCDGNRKDLSGSGPLAIGLSIAMCHLWAVPLTGSGMNPARVFGPAVVSGSWTYHWVYWIGPLIGGVAAGFLYDFFFAVNATPSKIAGLFSTCNFDDGNYDARGRKVGSSETQELKGSA